MSNNPSRQGYMTWLPASNRIGLPIATLKRLAAEGAIPTLRTGGRTYLCPDTVLDALRDLAAHQTVGASKEKT